MGQPIASAYALIVVAASSFNANLLRIKRRPTGPARCGSVADPAGEVEHERPTVPLSQPAKVGLLAKWGLT